MSSHFKNLNKFENLKLRVKIEGDSEEIVNKLFRKNKFSTRKFKVNGIIR